MKLNGYAAKEAVAEAKVSEIAASVKERLSEQQTSKTFSDTHIAIIGMAKPKSRLYAEIER